MTVCPYTQVKLVPQNTDQTSLKRVIGTADSRGAKDPESIQKFFVDMLDKSKIKMTKGKTK